MIIIRIVLFLTFLGLATSTLQKYGDICDPNGLKKALLCDGDLLLTCTPDKMCKCKMLANVDGINNIPTVYMKNSCRVRANATCAFTKDGAEIIYECLNNSKCEENICRCNEGYHSNGDGTGCRSGTAGISALAILVFNAFTVLIFLE